MYHAIPFWNAKGWEEKNLQPKIFYPEWLSVRIEGEIMSFPYEQKIKEYIIAKQALK